MFLIICLRFVVAAQYVYELMFDALLNKLSCRSKILSGIEMSGILGKMLSDGGSEGEAQV